MSIQYLNIRVPSLAFWYPSVPCILILLKQSKSLFTRLSKQAVALMVGIRNAYHGIHCSMYEINKLC